MTRNGAGVLRVGFTALLLLTACNSDEALDPGPVSKSVLTTAAAPDLATFTDRALLLAAAPDLLYTTVDFSTADDGSALVVCAPGLTCIQPFGTLQLRGVKFTDISVRNDGTTSALFTDAKVTYFELPPHTHSVGMDLSTFETPDAAIWNFVVGTSAGPVVGRGLNEPGSVFIGATSPDPILWVEVYFNNDFAGGPHLLDNLVFGVIGLSQTVTFTSAPPSPAFVGGSYTATAIGGGSGNPVTFSSLSAGTCEVLGSTVGFIAAGSCTIAADQAGDATYSAAEQATQVFTVSPVDHGTVNIQRTVLWNGEARGINRDRAVVGFGSFPGAIGSGALVWWPGSVTPLELPVLPGDNTGMPIAINDAWQIVGSSGGPNRRAVLWQPNANRTAWTVHDLGVPPAASGGTQAEAINNAGVVVGTAGSNGFVWVPGTTNGSTGTVQRLCATLNALNCLTSTAYGINDHGQIAGSGTYTGNVTAFSDAAIVATPPDWTYGVMLPYMDQADRQGNHVLGIDAAGNVVGTTTLYDALLVPNVGFTYRCIDRVLQPTTQFCAVAMLWPAGGGAPIDLGSFGGQYANEPNASALVGDASEIQVVGLSSDPTGHFFPFRWTQLTGMQRLPLPSASQQGRAYGINSRGDMVGTYEDGFSRAVVWHPTPLLSASTSQAITFTSAPPSPAQVGASYSVSATGGASGNPVVFTTPNASCSVDGSVVSLVAVGSCRITANQDGNSGYAAAPAVDQTFDVVKGDQAIIFTTTPPDPAFVGNSYSVAATGGGSGNPVQFTTGDGSCSVTGSTVTFAGSGSCRVLADQAGSANYDSAPQVAQTITIVKQAQAVAFTSTPPSPALLGGNYTVTARGGGSGIAVTFSSLTPATCTVTSSNVAFIRIGPCTLAADQAGSAAYLPAPRQTQQLTVIYPFTGFFQPVDGAGTLNVLKAGKAVPVRFSLGGNRGLSILQGTPATVTIVCGNGPRDAIEETSPTAQTGLRYDVAANQYTYIWPTDKAWVGTCRRVTLTLNDGTTHSAIFELTK